STTAQSREGCRALLAGALPIWRPGHLQPWEIARRQGREGVRATIVRGRVQATEFGRAPNSQPAARGGCDELLLGEDHLPAEVNAWIGKRCVVAAFALDDDISSLLGPLP